MRRLDIPEFRIRTLYGLSELADTVGATMGTAGGNVMFMFSDQNFGLTKDGVTVAKAFHITKDTCAHAAATYMLSAAEETNKKAGDGPQPLHSKILTPNGWTTMGQIKAGDKICGTNGTVQDVLGVFPKGEKEIYELHFSNGRVVECCEDHTWSLIKAYSGSKDKKLVNITVKELIEVGITKIGSTGDTIHKFYVPKSEAYFEEKELPLDPYLVGVLLGDGSLNESSIELCIGVKKEGIIDKLNLPEGIYLKVSLCDYRNCFRIKFGGQTSTGKTMKDLLTEIGIFGLKSSNKKIPSEYIYSSIQQRELLLNGLLDTDGYYNPRGLFEFSTISEQLYKDVLELVWSLGKTVYHTLHTREKDENSYSTIPIYRIYELKGYKHGVKLVDIVKTDRKAEMQCIKVSNEDSLYFTNDYILTHNTTTATVLGAAIYTAGLILVNELPKTTDFSGSLPSYLKDEILLDTSKYKNFSIPKSVFIDGPIDTPEVKFIQNIDKEHLTRYEFAKLCDVYEEDICMELNEISNLINLESEDIVKSVATISSNGDSHMQELISKAFKLVNMNGVVVGETVVGGKSSVRQIDGFSFEGQPAHPAMLNANTNTVEFTDAIIFLSDKYIEHPDDITTVLKLSKETGRPFVLVTGDVSDNLLNQMVLTMFRENIRGIVVKAPEYGAERVSWLHDLEAVTGATFLDGTGNALRTAKLQHTGTCEKVIVTINGTSITGHTDNPERVEAIKSRIAHLEEQAKADGITPKGVELINKRIANLNGKFAEIVYAVNTAPEEEEAKYRLEDALNAVQTALKEGVVPGGGTALIHAASSVVADSSDCQKHRPGVPDHIMAKYPMFKKVMQGALFAPFDKLISNSGKDAKKAYIELCREGLIFEGLEGSYSGIDLQTGSVVDLVLAGILDPKNVTKSAFKSALGVAKTLIQTVKMQTNE